MSLARIFSSSSPRERHKVKDSRRILFVRKPWKWQKLKLLRPATQKRTAWSRNLRVCLWHGTQKVMNLQRSDPTDVTNACYTSQQEAAHHWKNHSQIFKGRLGRFQHEWSLCYFRFNGESGDVDNVILRAEIPKVVIKASDYKMRQVYYCEEYRMFY